MGQYHLILNLDKRQYLEPHAFGEGAKLLEFGCSMEGTMTALAALLARDNGKGGGDLYPPEGTSDTALIGSWAGDRIVIAGDYGEPGDLVDSSDAGLFALTQEGLRFVLRDPKVAPNVYKVAQQIFDNVSDRVIRLLQASEGADTKLHFIDLTDPVRSRFDMVFEGQKREQQFREMLERQAMRDAVLEEFSRMPVERVAELMQQRARQRV